MGSVGDCYDNAVCETSTPASRKSGSTGSRGQPAPRRAPRSSSTSRAGTTRGVGTPRSATSPRSSSSDSTPSSPSWRSRPRFRATDRSRRSHPGAQTGLQRVASQRSASISLPTPRSLPRTPSLLQPIPLRPRRTAVKGRTATGGLAARKSRTRLADRNIKLQQPRRVVQTGGGPVRAGVTAVATACSPKQKPPATASATRTALSESLSSHPTENTNPMLKFGLELRPTFR